MLGQPPFLGFVPFLSPLLDEQDGWCMLHDQLFGVLLFLVCREDAL